MACPPEVLLRFALRGKFVLRTRPITQLKPTSTVHYQAQRTYRAAQCQELGKPLVLARLPSQELQSGQVRIKVCAAGVNFGDLLMIQGAYQEKPPLPFVAGSELAGEVLDIGDDVTNFRKGDRVVGLTFNLGAFAEEAVCNQYELWHIPKSIDYVTAASLPCSYGTAWLGLTRRAKVREGETVLVTAAAGAVGLAAVDLASHVLGAKVIGAAGGPEKCQLLEKRGAFATIDYKTESIRDKTKEVTDGEGANVIFESVGGDTFKQCLRSIAWEGRIMVIGFAGGEVPKIPANILLVKNVSAIGFYWGQHALKDNAAYRKSVEDVFKLCDQGKISPHIGKVWTLDQVNEAFLSVKDRKSTGKVVVKMD
ncbi:quinone oxidoreductase-like protein 2 homolog isoform X2 [Apostichopus japonicus]|uniref:quinone oxidoreductase-like protein 2 homolog isoform X2 n=1 Tax=Stichopus japonicus TaxID=307972 RepID=UPI003AB783A9